ncbi:permease [Acidaminobacter sp. JC074]|uniref:permease n=1 Tax=Acidaminobacter sp. JC074 TaxID=2530199 RepID=UPI001F104C16|nr:permease [Acidaminobacter sp. JC074]MCH4887315.1 permease [Acidaminobacter sp. JC074]
MTTLILIGIALVSFLISIKKDKTKTLDSLKQARKMMKSMLSDIIGILLLIGLVLALIPSEMIEKLIGGETGLIAVIVSALVGTVTLIPAFVAFPLIGSLKANGAGIMALTAFLTTLTMVGFLTMPLEIKTFGKKFTLVRNALSFTFAIIISLIMGVIL